MVRSTDMERSHGLMAGNTLESGGMTISLDWALTPGLMERHTSESGGMAHSLNDDGSVKGGKQMKRLIMLLLILTVVPFLTIPRIAFAAEVTNLKLTQVKNTIVATYDLVGNQGEKFEVIVNITVGDERRTAEELSLNGDFGKGVKVGKGKKIVWKVMKDFPQGLAGAPQWDLYTGSQEVTGSNGRGESRPESGYVEHGTYTFPNGDMYDGRWKNDKPNGQGALTGSDGTKIVSPPSDPHALEGTINKALKNAGLTKVTAEVNENLEVTLQGTASNSKDKGKAFDAAKHTKGVSKITDKVFVVEP
ncbi:MAG: BON domain-containing protein [Nitrospirae bacterium]|nr:BON domain-containing protein [Nitrospirota bacterium]